MHHPFLTKLISLDCNLKVGQRRSWVAEDVMIHELTQARSVDSDFTMRDFENERVLVVEVQRCVSTLVEHLPAEFMDVKNDRAIESELHIPHFRLSRDRARVQIRGDLDQSDGRRGGRRGGLDAGGRTP